MVLLQAHLATKQSCCIEAQLRPVVAPKHDMLYVISSGQQPGACGAYRPATSTRCRHDELRRASAVLLLAVEPHKTAVVGAELPRCWTAAYACPTACDTGAARDSIGLLAAQTAAAAALCAAAVLLGACLLQVLQRPPRCQ